MKKICVVHSIYRDELAHGIMEFLSYNNYLVTLDPYEDYDILVALREPDGSLHPGIIMEIRDARKNRKKVIIGAGYFSYLLNELEMICNRIGDDKHEITKTDPDTE